MLYPKNNTPALDPQLFREPTAEYRGAPFWSWNAKLDRARLFAQLEALKAMGMGGFHTHCRTGLATPYLGEEFMGHVRACVEKARDDGMLAWLYDEDRWPSGFAGGLVTRDMRHRAKHLLVTSTPYRGQTDAHVGDEMFTGRFENGVLVAQYHIDFVDGCLGSYRRLHEGEPGANWFVYLETPRPTPWFNHQTYVDTLSPAAMQRFTEVTHNVYQDALGEFMGTTVPAMFTDEPRFTRHFPPARADDRSDSFLAWTTDFADTYRERYGEDILDLLPEIIWQLPGNRPSRTRYRYHDHRADRFAEAFAGTLGRWCEHHGIALTGHCMEEARLLVQTSISGEVMRLLAHFQLPGIDMLCDELELTTAKQAQSVARQFHRPGVTSELYGVTNWDFDFTGHKRQGDWQAALGVTVRVHHLAWLSMAGESKRDYPAPIDEHSPWYREYRLVENHFGRLNTVLTRGKPVCRVGVIHPIESYWLDYGPNDQTYTERAARDTTFEALPRWLLNGLVDFDYISEALWPTQQLDYDCIVVPGLKTIRSTTLEKLDAFPGKVLFAGDVPTFVDGEPRDIGQRQSIPLAEIALLDALAPYRALTVLADNGQPASGLLHQLRQDGEDRYLFLCNTSRDQGLPNATIKIPGQWSLTEMDTLTGDQRPLPAKVTRSETTFRRDLHAAGHLLLRLSPTSVETSVPSGVTSVMTEIAQLAGPVPVTLHEPNVLLLDQAESRLDDGEWQPVEEVLRACLALKKMAGYEVWGAQNAQPWAEPPLPEDHRATLRFTFECDVPSSVKLALERAEVAAIRVDGKAVGHHGDGYWVDEAICTIPLPDLAEGRHTIEITWPFGQLTDLEWCYLLGDFGVEVAGRTARIVAPVRQLHFGDWTRQGLPFYAGNVTYHCCVTGTGRPLALRAPRFVAPLLKVAVDGRLAGPIAFPPYQLDLGALSPGDHQLDITAFGSRINALGQLHNCNPRERWWGPWSYRSKDDAWSYEYQIKPQGLLVAPRVLTPETHAGKP